MTTEVVIAVELPTLAHGGERVLQIARWLTRRGIAVEIVALGEGTKPELATFRAVAPTTVIDRFRRRGVAAVPHLLGQRRATSGWKRLRIRRWMESRRHATFLLHDPLTASLVRYSPIRPHRIVAAFPDPSWSFSRTRPEDRDTLLQADGWITSDATQTAEVAASFEGPIVELGSAEAAGTFIDRADLPSVSLADPLPGTAVLLSPIGLWDAIDHAIEIAWRLHQRLPELRFRWVIDDEQDRWLADHDLVHAGLEWVVQVVGSHEPGLLEDVSMVLRTGYEPCHGELALAAALGGVPVGGMCVSDLTEDTPQAAAFDVDALVGEFSALATDPEGLAARGSALRGRLAHLDLDHHISTLTTLLVPERP